MLRFHVGVSDFILRKVGNNLSSVFIDALQKEEKGQPLPVLNANTKLEKVIVIYLEGRYGVYSGVNKFIPMDTEYDWLELSHGYTQCEMYLMRGEYSDLLELLPSYVERTKMTYPYLNSLFKIILGQVWHDLPAVLKVTS